MSSHDPPDSPGLVDLFYTGFQSILSLPAERITAVGDSEALPTFPEDDLISLCRLARDRFMHQSSLIRVPVPICIIGDIHGSFHDLIRLLHHFGPTARYLFLGDYVDRGEFSIECITLLFAFMCKCPDRVFLLRGNHEFPEICAQYGFKEDVLGSYSETLFDAFMEAFSYMPLAAVVNNAIFCVHGGIGAVITSVNDLEHLPRPISTDRDDLLIRTLVWADPVSENVKYGQATRSDVRSYGVIAAREFLRDNKLKLIIRAHQCVNGVQLAAGFPVITVFSASNYRVKPPNDSGVVTISANGELEKITFPPIERMPRGSASFFSLGGSTARCENALMIRGIPSAVIRQAALMALRKPRRTLAQNSVAALLLPRKLLPLQKLVSHSGSFSSRLSSELP
jgi:protein phosphatase